MEKKEVKKGPDTRRKCPICRKRYDGYGHNALPVWPGRCCDKCFRDYVIPDYNGRVIEKKASELAEALRGAEDKKDEKK